MSACTIVCGKPLKNLFDPKYFNLYMNSKKYIGKHFRRCVCSVSGTFFNNKMSSLSDGKISGKCRGSTPYLVWKASNSSWSYDSNSESGPEQWLSKYSDSKVSGLKQSPIAIDTCNTIYDQRLKEDKWEIWEPQTKTAMLLNTGRSIQANFCSRHFVSGGGLPSLYQAAQYHFHWGTDEQGSEHSIDGRFFALELHIVCFDTVRFSNVDEAAQNPDGLAVLGVMFELGAESKELSELLKHIDLIKDTVDASTKFSTPSIEDWLPEVTERGEFYRYPGSLTTPPLFESVVWTLIKSPLTVSRDQLAELRTLQKYGNCGCILNNARPLQPLGERVVHRSFHDTSASEPTQYSE